MAKLDVHHCESPNHLYQKLHNESKIVRQQLRTKKPRLRSGIICNLSRIFSLGRQAVVATDASDAKKQLDKSNASEVVRIGACVMSAPVPQLGTVSLGKLCRLRQYVIGQGR